MQINIKQVLVLSILLMLTLTSVASAADEQINITYIAYKSSDALETASQTSPYSDYINITYINYYDSSKEPKVNDDIIEAAENGFFETQDIIFCCMVSGDAYSAINDSLKAAHDSGTSLLSIKTKLPTVPTYFDYMAYYEGEIDPTDTIAVYYDNMGTSDKGLENAENLLTYLAKEYGNHDVLTASWGTTSSNYDEFLFILGTDFNKDNLTTASNVADIDLHLNTTILSAAEVADDFNFSHYGVIFIESQPEELVNTTWRSGINSARAAGANVIGYNLSDNITLTNVDLSSENYTAIERYWIQGGETNMESMLKVMGQKFAGLWTTKTYTPEIIQPRMNVTFILSVSEDSAIYYINTIKNGDNVITDRFNVNVMTGSDAKSNSMDFTNEDLIILYMIGSDMNDIHGKLQTSGAQIGMFGMDDIYNIATFNMTSDEYSVLTKYLENDGYENMENWIRRLGATFGDVYIEYAEPANPAVATDGIYHPDAFPRIFENSTEYLEWYADHGYNESAPTIGIICGSTLPQKIIEYTTDDAIIRDLESKGCNVIYTTASVCTGDVDYFIKDGDVLVDSIISLKGFYLNYYGNHTNGDEYLENTYNVPVLKAIKDTYQTTDKYLQSSGGLTTDSLAYQVIQPEIDGLLDCIVIAGKNTNQETNETYDQPIDEQLQWACDRAIAWAELGNMNNSDKKVTIIYYNHDGGKNNIGASYLDIGDSFPLLIKAMEDAGYDIGNNTIPNGTEFVDLFVESRNVGTWAPGELEKVVESGYVTLLPAENYLEWYNTLPESVREDVENTWGEAPGEVMTYTNETDGKEYFVIPTIQLGNINFVPQPMRAVTSDESLIFHNGSLPPTHQYLATYYWINNEYDADAMIHFGTHGTQEWLPGKEVGLWRYDYPSIMVDDTPVIYPYIMDNVGEGTQAKRRGNAVIIDHLTPAIIESGLYGDLVTLKEKMEEYLEAKDAYAANNNSSNSVMMELYRDSTIELYDNLSLSTGLGVSSDELNSMSDDDFANFLETDLEDYLDEIKSELIPYGLHIFGVAPQGDELVGMVKSMIGNDITDHIYNVLTTGTDDEKEEQADNATMMLLNATLLDGTGILEAQDSILGLNDTNITTDLELASGYAYNLSLTTREIDQTLNALNAEYIETATGNDPILNPDALPTGRNFYSFDQRTIPDKESEEMGRILINNWLNTTYDTENGTYPNKVAFVLWSVETMRNEGLAEAQIYALLGVGLNRSSSSGRINGMYVIPLEELGHPRIDVVITTSGLYRDTFPLQMQWIDEAVRLAANQTDEPNSSNYVRWNSLRIEDELLKNGYEPGLAYNLSRSRVFGEAPGSYGTGVPEAVTASETWDNSSEVAELYISRMGYVYGLDMSGVCYEDLFKLNLKDVEAAIISDSSNLYGIVDNDDYYSYFGALGLAVEYVSGNYPDMFIANFANMLNPEIETLEEVFNKEMINRYLNPEWITGMMNYGAAGAREIMNTFENLWGWEVANPELVTDSTWNSMYETYVLDSQNTGVDEFLKGNPFQYQSIVDTMINAIYEGYWDAPEEVLNNLIKEHVESVVENGVTCCHHTCGNLPLGGFIADKMTGVVDDATAAEYKRLMEEATHKSFSDSTETTTTSRSSSSTGTEFTVSESSSSTVNRTTVTDGGVGSDLMSPAQNAPESTPSNYVEGYEMTNEKTTNVNSDSGSAYSSSDIIASILVLAAAGVMYLGFVRKH